MFNTKSSWTKTLLKLMMVVPAFSKLISKFCILIENEVSVAGRGLLILVILCALAASLVTSIWVCLFALLYVYYVSIGVSAITSLLIILAVNVLLLCLVGLIIFQVKKHFFFTETRKMLRHLPRKI